MLPEAKHKNLPRDYNRAKELRRNSSRAEDILWFELRQYGKLVGLSFRRQQPIHPYIVDFSCMKLKLVVEIDGPSHDFTLTQDEIRTKYLNKRGYKVFRYTNEEVFENVNSVIDTLDLEIKNLAAATPLLTSPARGEEPCRKAVQK